MPAWLIPAALAAAQGIGSIFSSRSASKDRGEQKRQFDLEFGLKQRQYGDEQARQQMADPTRRMIIAALAKRFGLDLGSAFLPKQLAGGARGIQGSGLPGAPPQAMPMRDAPEPENPLISTLAKRFGY